MPTERGELVIKYLQLGVALICALALLTVMVVYTIAPPKSEVRRSPDPVKYVLDVRQPDNFLTEHLPRALRDFPLVAEQAIDQNAVVELRNGEKSVSMNVILISGVRMDENEYYIRLVGAKQEVSEAYDLAIQICGVVGIADIKVQEWFKEQDFRQGSGKKCLQVGQTSDSRQHEVATSNSLSPRFKPWAVDYTIYFSIP